MERRLPINQNFLNLHLVKADANPDPTIPNMQHLRNLLFLLAFLALTITGFGQTNKLKLGGEGGINRASLWINGLSSEFKWGGQLGLFAQIPVNERVSLKTGLYMEQKGARLSPTLADNADTYGKSPLILALNYLTLPFLLRADFGHNVRFFVNGGPYVGVLLQSHLTETDSGNPVDTDRFKKTDLGLVGGAGLSFPIAKNYDLSFELRDCLGLINVYNTSSGGTIRTNTIQFLIGIAYTLGGEN